MNHHLNRTLFSLGVLVAALSVAQDAVMTPCQVEASTRRVR